MRIGVYAGVMPFMLVFLLTTGTEAAMTSASYQITSAVMPSAAGSMATTSYALTATLGQPTPIDKSSSASYTISTGFWPNILQVIGIGDVNGDGVVDLADVITSLQVITGNNLTNLHLEADVDNDGKIGMGEVIFDLQEAAGSSSK